MGDKKVVSADWEVTYGTPLLYHTNDSYFYAISLFFITNHVKGEAANPDEVDGDSKGQDYQWFPIRRGFPGGRIRWTGTRGVMSINGRK